MRLAKAEKPNIDCFEIPEGRAGVIVTLKAMRKLAREYRKNPTIVYLSRSLLSGVAQKDWMEEIRRLHFFVRDNIRYTLDVNDVETLLSPVHLLEIGHGDCDDKATLLAAMLESVGHPARFVAVGAIPGELSHVYVETRVGDSWIPLDPTEPVDIGWQPPNMAERYTVHL